MNKSSCIKKILFSLVISLFTSLGFAQTWKTNLDSGLIFIEKDYNKALEYILLAKKNIPVDSASTFSNAEILKTLANIYFEMGQYEKAELFYIEVKDITGNILGKMHPDYAGSLNNLAIHYSYMGKPEKAELNYIEVKSILEKTLGKTDYHYANLLNNLAIHYDVMGQFERAEPLYIESLDITEKTLGKFSPDYASSLNNLALLYGNIGQYEKAESIFIESLDITEKSLGKANPEYAQSLTNLASLYSQISKFEKAETLYIEAKNIYEKVLGKDNPHYALSLDGLASLYYSKLQFQKAEEFYIEAKNIREKSLGQDHPLYVHSLLSLAYVKWNTNKPLLADTLFKEAFTKKYHQIKKVLQFTSEKEKSAFINNIIGSNDAYNSFYYQNNLNTSAVALYTISFLSRSLILSSTQQLRKTINSINNKNALADYERWSSLKKQLAALYSNGKIGDYVTELEYRADLLEKNLARISSDFMNINEEKSLQDIQQKLKTGEAAIEFVEFNYGSGTIWTDSTYYIGLVLRKDKPEPLLVKLFEKKQLDSILLRTSDNNTNNNVTALYANRGVDLIRKDSIKMNKALYNLVWKPLENELKDINTIYFAPAGMLHRISFAALPVNDTLVLSDQYKLVQLATTETVIDQQPFFVSNSDKINLFGGISYNADSTALKNAVRVYHSSKPSTRSSPSDITRGDTWEDLPGTAKEVEGIVTMGNPKNNISVFKGINATEESIKSLEGTNSPVIIHIATHGFFFSDPKQEKKYKMEMEGVINGKVFKQSDDPMFRSGLLFAGANNTWSGKAVEGVEDGILTSYEVSNMYLPNTKLVILSACETGLGDIKGSEGVYGLQRAFKMAGVENLIMSLWKVPDSETAEFMEEFYKNLFTKKSIADAFYNAQTLMKNKYRKDPYKWAAWVLVR